MRSTALAAFALASLAAPAFAGNCTPTRLLLVLDKSSSMNDTLANSNTSKWHAAQQAVSTIGKGFEKKIDLGLMVFPNPSQCSPGKVVIPPGAQNASKIDAAMMGDPPVGGNYTPMSQSIDVAAADNSLHDKTRNPSILLITDGWQWCDPYDGKTRFWPVDSVMKAHAMGIKVYVVGFGSAVDVLTLNRMAHESGTELAGCDPMGDQLNSPNKCYYQADDLKALQAALESIALKASAEVCDGLDNDCNGIADEALARSCMTACGGGMEQCMNGQWVGCDAPQVLPELCDGADNDCNGAVDEGCDCVAGATRKCGSSKGACREGLQTCGQDGIWIGDCPGAVLPSAEICNGVDDDCNGTVDDPSPSLCPMGAECKEGKCQELKPAPTGGDEGEGGSPQPGCGCTVGGRTPDASIPIILLGVAVALAWLLRRKA